MEDATVDAATQRKRTNASSEWKGCNVPRLSLCLRALEEDGSVLIARSRGESESSIRSYVGKRRCRRIREMSRQPRTYTSRVRRSHAASVAVLHFKRPNNASEIASRVNSMRTLYERQARAARMQFRAASKEKEETNAAALRARVAVRGQNQE